VKNLINFFHNSDFFGQIFHTLNYCLKKELKNCKSVLDLGCGPSSPLQYCRGIKYSVGVEPFKPYLEESKRKKIHTEYISEKMEAVSFPDNSFDAVIMVEVLEHLPKKVGYEILKRAEKWAKEKVIISTPNGYFPMGKVDQNCWQRHFSGWLAENFKKLGYKCFGLAGLKFFYYDRNKVVSLVSNDNDNSSNLRFKPKNLFFVINSFFQIFNYYFPKFSFELLAVKKLKNV